MRRPTGRGAVAALVFLIAACAAPLPPDRTPTTATTPAKAPAEAPDTTKAISAGAAPADGPADRAVVQEVKAAAPPRPASEPEPLPEPGELIGLTYDAVKERLGAPAFTRSDPPAAIWQYRKDGCLLDLYFYAADGRLRVRHFEFRPDPQKESQQEEIGAQGGTAGDVPATDAKTCYAALIRAHGERAQR